MTKNKALLQLLDLVIHDPSSITGLRWLDGTAVGTAFKGYYVMAYDKHTFAVHSIIWQLNNGPIPRGYEVDHIDLNGLNNSPSNMRLATHAQNCWNKKLCVRNKTGIKGLTFDKRNDCWRGQIMTNKISTSFRSKDKNEVEKWLISERLKQHGNFARHS